LQSLTPVQSIDETPDYTDSDTNANTTASSVVGETVDGRKRRTEANQLRRSIFGKKHDALGESKVWASYNNSSYQPCLSLNNHQHFLTNSFLYRKMMVSDASSTCLA
jgi:hypothetical protein